MQDQIGLGKDVIDALVGEASAYRMSSMMQNQAAIGWFGEMTRRTMATMSL